MKKTTKTKNIKSGGAGKIAALGAGAAALGGAAYYFLGPKGKQHQKTAQKWALDLEKRIVREAKRGKKISDVIYATLMETDAQLRGKARK
jgi:hypothetical protein